MATRQAFLFLHVRLHYDLALAEPLVDGVMIRFGKDF